MIVNLDVQSRDLKSRPSKLTEQGIIPGIVYGPEISPVPVQIQKKVFHKIYKEAGESNLIDLKVDAGEAVKVLIQDIQKDPVSDNIIHVDFRQINMKKVLHTKIPLEFSGESTAVKELAGVLVKNLHEIEIKCLPVDLVSSISVDISVLKTFADVIHIKDLNIPQRIIILNNPEIIVVKVVEHKEEEVEKGPQSVAEVEVVGKKKEDGEAPEAGAEAAATAAEDAGKDKKAGAEKKAEKKS